MRYKIRMIRGKEHIVDIKEGSSGMSPLVNLIKDMRRMPSDTIEPHLQCFESFGWSSSDDTTKKIVLNTSQIESIVPVA